VDTNYLYNEIKKYKGGVRKLNDFLRNCKEKMKGGYRIKPENLKC